MIYEPGPLAPLAPLALDRIGAERPMTTLLAADVGSFAGADVALDTAQASLLEARGDTIDAAEDRTLDEAAAQLQAESGVDAGAEIAELVEASRDFDRELARLADAIPVEGGVPQYGTVGIPADRFEAKPGGDDHSSGGEPSGPVI